jgi:hypothetical protein
MEKLGKTLRSILQVGLLILVICFLSAKTYPSTNKTQTYVSKNGFLSSPLLRYSGLLFAQQINDSIKAEWWDSIHGERSRTIKLKDPKMAVFYAFIPGIVVHGSGHFYARKTKTGFLLLGAEVVGVSLVGWSAFATAMGGYDPGVELLGFGGLMLFVGSWVYDVVGSPIAVKKDNQKRVGMKSINLKFEFDHKYDSIRVVLVRQF